MAGRFLQAFKPIARFLPEIKAPERRVGFNEKLFWTAMAVVLYLIMAEVPLFLPPESTGGWEMSYLRIIFASHRGTLLELGIGPIVTAGLILQLLAGSGMIDIDMASPEDRGLFTSASKFFSIVLTGVQASAYILGGVYGTLPARNAIIVFLQLMAAGVIIMLLDELVQKGWGIGSGISLFIVAGVAQQIMISCFSLAPAAGERRNFGVFVALVQSLAASGIAGINDVLFRVGQNPSLIGFFTTLIVFFIVIYFEGVRVELPIAHADYRGFRGRYPIKLLYVSNLPVIFASALFANVYFFSQLFWSRFNQNNQNFWLNLLGTYEWGEPDAQGRRSPRPTGGLVKYVLAPQSIQNVVEDPLRAFGFAAIMVGFCIIFSLTWLEVGGLGPSTVAQQLVDSGMHVPGYRRSAKPIESLLKRYIPAVTILGGAIVGLIAAVADFFGVFGSGMGILLSVGILYQYYQLLIQERVAEMYPAFRRFLGE